MFSNIETIRNLPTSPDQRVINDPRSGWSMDLLNNKNLLFNDNINIELSSSILEVLSRYHQAGGTRSDHVFKWSKALVKTGMVLSSVETKYLHGVVDARILMIILISYINDIIDSRKDGEKLINKIKIHTIQNVTEAEIYSEDVDPFILMIWKKFYMIVKELPCFDQYFQHFIIDIGRTLDSIFLTLDGLLTNNRTQNESLLDIFSYCMGVVAFLDIDMMASKQFDRSEFLDIREFMKICQKMARISTCLASWEVEVEKGLYISMPIFYAINDGIISHEEIENDRRYIIKEKIKNSMIEYKLMRKFDNYLVNLYEYVDKIKSINIYDYIKGMIIFLQINLMHRGNQLLK